MVPQGAGPAHDSPGDTSGLRRTAATRANTCPTAAEGQAALGTTPSGSPATASLSVQAHLASATDSFTVGCAARGKVLSLSGSLHPAL